MGLLAQILRLTLFLLMSVTHSDCGDFKSVRIDRSNIVQTIHMQCEEGYYIQASELLYYRHNDQAACQIRTNSDRYAQNPLCAYKSHCQMNVGDLMEKWVIYFCDIQCYGQINYLYQCPTKYYELKYTCEKIIAEECGEQSRYCFNQGRCSLNSGSISCKCEEGFAGFRCNRDLKGYKNRYSELPVYGKDYGAVEDEENDISEWMTPFGDEIVNTKRLAISKASRNSTRLLICGKGQYVQEYTLKYFSKDKPFRLPKTCTIDSQDIWKHPLSKYGKDFHIDLPYLLQLLSKFCQIDCYNSWPKNEPCDTDYYRLEYKCIEFNKVNCGKKSRYCFYNGMCFMSDSKHGIFCKCQKGFYGSRCTNSIAVETLPKAIQEDDQSSDFYLTIQKYAAVGMFVGLCAIIIYGLVAVQPFYIQGLRRLRRRCRSIRNQAVRAVVHCISLIRTFCAFIRRCVLYIAITLIYSSIRSCVLFILQSLQRRERDPSRQGIDLSEVSPRRPLHPNS